MLSVLSGLLLYCHHSVDELCCVQRGGFLSASEPGIKRTRLSQCGAGRCCESLQGGVGVTLLRLLLLHQLSVMWHDFTLREVERHLQSDQDSELKRYQLPPADSETLLQLINEVFDLLFLEVTADLSSQ